MRWTISLLAAVFALAAAPSASAMELPTMTLGHAVATVRSATASAQRRHAPRHRFTLLDESAGTAVRARPAGRVLGTLAGRTPLGTPTWLWADAFRRNHCCARAVLPSRPNGRTARVRRLPAGLGGGAVGAEARAAARHAGRHPPVGHDSATRWRR